MQEDHLRMIEAVRAHRLVGRGSCTSIDECYDDEELLQTLLEHDAETPEDAIRVCVELEGLHMEQGLNQRWGEDDDPQLLEYNEWKDALRDEGLEDAP